MAGQKRMERVSLVLGGARSGKSRLAQAWAEAHAGPLVYVATAAAWDAEMESRIAHHRADRGDRWRTVEEQVDLAGALERIGADDAPGAVVVDCLTLWLSNLMLGEHDVEAAAERLCAALHACPCPVYVVSNEVGWGIVPETPLGRAFRDEAGRLNQRLAAVAHRVALIVAGLPLWLKGG